MKRFISFLLVVAFIFGICVTANAENDNALHFGADGKFSIMHVTDTHLENTNVDASVWAIGEACDRENPDLVVITGDNVKNSNNADETKELITKLMTVFEVRNIPVAVTFGNHDSEDGAMSREELMAYYNTFDCSVSVDDGEALSGCGTYNLPVYASNGDSVKFNVWVFDSGDYDSEGNYGCVQADQVEWYKNKAKALKEANGGETVYSLAFQHIIVPEIYDVFEKTDKKGLFTFEHRYNDGEYYRFDPEQDNHGILTETPCCGYLNFGQFDAMVETGDVLAVFSGHEHMNGFSVKNQGIDIVNSISTRYNGDAYSSAYGYRMIEIDENNTRIYSTRVVRWNKLFSIKDAFDYKADGDDFGFRTALDIAFKGFFKKLGDMIYHGFAALITGRQIKYPD